MSDKELVIATITALAAIDAELGLPEDGCNSTARTLTAIRLLHSVHRDDVTEIERLECELTRTEYERHMTALERDALRAENERLKIEAARHETEMGEVIDERDEMESALSAAHVALGGDGEWACRVPSPPPPDSGNLSLDVPVLAAQVLARAEAAAREAVAAWMIEHAFATGHGDTLTDLLAELSWQIAEIKRDAIKWRDTPIPVPPGECPYPIHADRSIEACVAAGDCGCGQNKT